MEPQPLEREANQGLDGVAHMALTREGLADPVADGAALGDAAPHIGQPRPANERVVGPTKDEEGIGLVQLQFAGVGRQPRAERRPGQVVLGQVGSQGARKARERARRAAQAR